MNLVSIYLEQQAKKPVLTEDVFEEFKQKIINGLGIPPETIEPDRMTFINGSVIQGVISHRHVTPTRRAVGVVIHDTAKDLAFERFLERERASLPEIDSDFDIWSLNRRE